MWENAGEDGIMTEELKYVPIYDIELNIHLNNLT